MEFLLDLLLSNIFFVALVIGGIISFIKRQAEQVEQKRTHHPIPKTEEKDEPLFDIEDIFNPFDLFEEETREKPVLVEKEAPKKKAERIEEPIIYEEEPIHETEIEAEIKNTHVEPSKVPQRSALSLQRLSNEEIVQGIVLAEILGPPRSRQLLPFTDPYGKRIK